MKGDNLILVGSIVAVHGIKGAVVVKSFTSRLENILEIALKNKDGEPVVLKKIGIKSKVGFICMVNEVIDRNEAEKLKKMALYCKRTDLPAIDDDNEFYINDLIGMDVRNDSGQLIAKVNQLYNFGAGDIVEVKSIKTQKMQMLPFNRQIFPVIEKDYILLAAQAENEDNEDKVDENGSS